MLGLSLSLTRAGVPIWTPRRLFAAGEQGAWYDPSDLSTLFQDAAGTTPVTAVGQPVGLMKDKSGRGNHASQSTTTARPTLQQDSGGRYYLSFDGVDDYLKTPDFLASGVHHIDCVSFRHLGGGTNYATIIDRGQGVDPKLDFSMARYNGTAEFNTRVDTLAGFNQTLKGGNPFDGSTHVSTFSTDGTQRENRLDGVRVSHAPVLGSTDFSGVALALAIGGGGVSSAQYANMRLYGAAYREGASAPSITQLERYLAARSGVTL